jgi:hypothetical protein
VFTLEGAAETTIAIVFAFGAAALLYLVTEELLVKAGKVPQTPVSTALFFMSSSRYSCSTLSGEIGRCHGEAVSYHSKGLYLLKQGDLHSVNTVMYGKNLCQRLSRNHTIV